ncbi:hypothetical protein ACFXMT_14225 [Streptomyces mirabilis]|uniref:deoxynucleotide monophosphate kinase family protein n=1 Tax=Streptomyces mirabilis TaxID=68239 RepID=UPI0036C7E0F6
MSYQSIALMGKARSGKDTAAHYLVRRYAFTRLALADPLKEMALKINPYVPTGYGITVRLEALIADVGWDYAKDQYAEVRRILQHVGQTVREYQEDFWLDILSGKVTAAYRWNMPVVVTDVRYPNEFAELRRRGFLMVRLERPSAGASSAEAQRHESETALNGYPPDVTLPNDGTIDDLNEWLNALVRSR